MGIKEEQQEKYFQRAFEGWKHLRGYEITNDALWVIGLFAAGLLSEWGWQFYVLLVLWIITSSSIGNKCQKLERIWLGWEL